MSTKLRELTVADFVLHARDEWECRKAGPFSIYRREVDGPPHWKLACGAYGKGMARAFVGMEPFGNMRLLKKVFGTVQTFLGGIGLNASPAANVNVLLWDPLFPLPLIREAAGRVDVISPETIARFGPSPSTLILLPTHRPGLHGGDVKRWLVSSAIHEGFHALLWDWLGAARTPKMRKAEAWKKFDEMCAVTLEYILAAKRSAWLDYGRAWQASMALSHNINDWPAFLPPGMAGFEHPVNVEEYGHFPFLAWMDEVIWPRHPRVGHWLVLTWEEGKKNGWTADPWEVLDKATPRQSLFSR